jgi:hypothetical protein
VRVGTGVVFRNWSDRQDRGFIRELVGAWILTFVLGAFGLALTSGHVADVYDGILVPGWHDARNTGAEPREEKMFESRGDDVMSAQIGNTGTGNTVAICDPIATAASEALTPRAPIADRSATPC